MTRAIRIAPDLAAASQIALARVIEFARRAVEARGRFSIALSGGNTPSGLYQALARPPSVSEIPWPRVEIFFGDERCVAPDDPESNYGMVKRTLLDQAPVLTANVHRIQGEIDPTMAAAEYEQELRRLFSLASGEWPRFDLILLGMGPDGHTASLFPHTQALGEFDHLVAANPVPQLQTTRITLTAPVINAAREVLFLVAGADKAGALQEVLEGPYEPDRLPAQLIQLHEGTLTWLVDSAAAARLRSVD